MTAYSTGLGLGAALLADPAPLVGTLSVSLTGLTNGEARPGSHGAIGYTLSAGSGTETVSWGISPGDATYGTGPNPTDFTGGDGGTLWLSVTRDGQTGTSNAQIRHAGGAGPVIAAQAWTVDDDVIGLDASASGANLVFSYGAMGLPGNAAIDAGTGAITVLGNGGAFAQADLDSGSIEITATDQYSRPISYSVAYTIALRPVATTTNALPDRNWTVDDDTVSLILTGDFAENGNTLSYVVSGLPAGLVDDGDGSIGGTPVVDGQSGTVTVTATDAYGREIVSAFGYTTAWRAAATAVGALGPFSFPENSAISGQPLAADFMPNGNALSYVISGTPLPAALSLSGAGSLTGTPADPVGQATYTVRGTDEYGRTTDSSFDLTITAADAFTLSETADAELELDGATGTVTVTVTNPAAYANYDVGNGAGIFTFDSVDLATAPVNLVPPRITDDGTPANGETLTLIPGLWVYDPDAGGIGLETYQWQVDTGGTGSFADIPGATSDTYVLTGTESGNSVRVGESLADNGGSRTADSAPVGVAATVPAAFVDANWSVATGSSTSGLDVTIASLPADGGATITDVEYRVDGAGSWTGLPSYAGTGTYTITMAAAGTSYGIELRSVNSVGNAAAGNTETATSAAPVGAPFTDTFDGYIAGQGIRAQSGYSDPGAGGDFLLVDGGAGDLHLVVATARPGNASGIVARTGDGLAASHYAEILVDFGLVNDNEYIDINLAADTFGNGLWGRVRSDGSCALIERRGGSAGIIVDTAIALLNATGTANAIRLSFDAVAETLTLTVNGVAYYSAWDVSGLNNGDLSFLGSEWGFRLTQNTATGDNPQSRITSVEAGDGA